MTFNRAVFTMLFLFAFPALAEEPTPEQEALTEVRNIVDALNRMKFSGYLQAQYVGNEASTPARNFDEFSLRRARIKFTYQFSSTSRFVLQPDVSSSGVTLKDGYAELTEPWTTWKHTLTAGQFNWPFGFEIMYSSSAREMPERSRVIRTLFPGERDRGVMLSGRGFRERFLYQVAIVNGSGTAQSSDANGRKDFVGRASYSLGALDLGASIYRGADLVAGREYEKSRQGIDFQWVTPLPGLGVRGEYITGRQPPSGATSLRQSPEVRGWYLYAIQNAGTRHQFVLRVDHYDPNTGSAGNATRTLGGSYIFHWDAHSKFLFAYEQPKLEASDPADDAFTLRYQYSF